MKVLCVCVVCIASILCGCSQNQLDVDEQQSEESVQKVIATGLVGEVLHVSIKTEMLNCTCEVDNPQIASGEIINSRYFITIGLLDIGETIIKVMGEDGVYIAIIYVSSLYFGSPAIQEKANHPTLRSEVFVEVEDMIVKKKIENELWAEIDSKRFTFYAFDRKTKEFMMKPHQGEIKIHGSYEWSLHSLVLKYGEVIEEYCFEKADRGCYILLSDKTKEYQLQYPTAGITKVQLKRIWYDCTYSMFL